VIENDEVALLEVESVELVAGLLCVNYFFIDDECGAFGVVGDSLAYLANWSELSKEFEEVFCRGVISQVLDEEDTVDFGCKFSAATHNLVTADVMNNP